MQNLIDRINIFNPNNIFGIEVKPLYDRVGYCTLHLTIPKTCPHCSNMKTEFYRPFQNREYYVCEGCIYEVRKIGEGKYFN